MYETSDFLEAIHDSRVARSLDLALRDAAIRRQFRQARRAGATVDHSILRLAASYYLSEERVRAIVYKK